MLCLGGGTPGRGGCFAHCAGTSSVRPDVIVFAPPPLARISSDVRGGQNEPVGAEVLSWRAGATDGGRPGHPSAVTGPGAAVVLTVRGGPASVPGKAGRWLVLLTRHLARDRQPGPGPWRSSLAAPGFALAVELIAGVVTGLMSGVEPKVTVRLWCGGVAGWWPEPRAGPTSGLAIGVAGAIGGSLGVPQPGHRAIPRAAVPATAAARHRAAGRPAARTARPHQANAMPGQQQVR